LEPSELVVQLLFETRTADPSSEDQSLCQLPGSDATVRTHSEGMPSPSWYRNLEWVGAISTCVLWTWEDDSRNEVSVRTPYMRPTSARLRCCHGRFGVHNETKVLSPPTPSPRRSPSPDLYVRPRMLQLFPTTAYQVCPRQSTCSLPPCFAGCKCSCEVARCPS
jgi:hypothetical protein